MAKKIVGIIGGMGPEATVDLMHRVVAATPADDDADHFRMLVDNNPGVPSRIKALIEGGGESPVACLVGMAQGLEHQGADFLTIPCNTAHHYYQEIAAAVKIPVINLIELTAGHIRQQQPELRKVGLLASDAVQRISLYEPSFAKYDIDVLYPKDENQKSVMAVIRSIKAKKQTQAQLEAYRQAARGLVEQGAECLIVACTELSLIDDLSFSGVPAYDAMDLLAQQIIHSALH